MKSLHLLSFIIALSMSLVAHAAPDTAANRSFIESMNAIKKTPIAIYHVDYHHNDNGPEILSVSLDEKIVLPLVSSKAITLDRSVIVVPVVTGSRLYLLRKRNVPVIKARQAFYFRLVDGESKDEAFVQALALTTSASVEISFLQQRPSQAERTHFQTIKVESLNLHADAVKAIISGN